MPAIAFWNFGGQRQLGTLLDLLIRYGVEILVIAEPGFDRAELIASYSRATGQTLYCPSLGHEIARVLFYSVFPNERFADVADRRYVSFKEYRPLVGQSVLLGAVHLPSKLRQDSKDLPFIASRVRKWVDEAEKQVGHERTILVGDFNMNPFEDGMVASDALHGVMDRRVAAKEKRTVLFDTHPYFYNPMWKLMGDSDNKALGTFFLGSGSNVHYFWDTFDQVLVRPALLNAFRDEELHILEGIGSRPLLSKGSVGIDVGLSDHLPILFKIHT